MKNTISELDSALNPEEWVQTKTDELKNEVKAYVLYIAWKEFDDEDMSVTFDEVYFRAFLALRKAGNHWVGIPVDFWKWLVKYACKSFHFVN
ncbi:MAG: hypothetical protein ACD_2C00017G0002 [uncultured bacterium (gcode 4)]|uniref:Uncharacterized protein n=1 Tax=uncultured bacterium (gcode 4) TaxID=1234023 RepID=K2H325_9BACT|nr:MAG: hypothetical protein ACD_2C00017G0002 [uncultured bacterium (gcode 4)]